MLRLNSIQKDVATINAKMTVTASLPGNRPDSFVCIKLSSVDQDELQKNGLPVTSKEGLVQLDLNLKDLAFWNKVVS